MVYYSTLTRPVGQAVKTLASHAENMGSIPVRVTNDKKERKSTPFCYHSKYILNNFIFISIKSKTGRICALFSSLYYILFTPAAAHDILCEKITRESGFIILLNNCALSPRILSCPAICYDIIIFTIFNLRCINS